MAIRVEEVVNFPNHQLNHEEVTKKEDEDSMTHFFFFFIFFSGHLVSSIRTPVMK